MCTSLQNIVTIGQRHLRQQDIQDLFQQKSYPRFELQQFYRHGLHEQHDQFRFFVDVLEEWNRKILTHESNHHFDTILHKNVFIYNSLRNAIMKPPVQAHQLLTLLYRWFNNTPSRNIKPVENKRKQLTEQDEDWLVRNTFKSNLPAEIDMYHRRFISKQKEVGEKSTNRQIGQKENEDLVRKVKTECWSREEHQRELQKKRIANIENQQVRFKREQEELEYVQFQWKMKRARREKENMKDYYHRATFSSGKTYFPKKRKTVKENSKPYRAQSYRRLKTISTEKRPSKNQLKQSQQSAITKNSIENTIYRNSENSNDKFQQFDEPERFRLSEVTGLRLMANPFQTKLKKKKRVK